MFWSTVLLIGGISVFFGIADKLWRYGDAGVFSVICGIIILGILVVLYELKYREMRR